MRSAWGIEHGVSKGIHQEALAARHVFGATSLKSFHIHNPKNPMVKRRVGQLRRMHDSRVDNPNQLRAYKDRKGKVSPAYVPPNPKFAKRFTALAPKLAGAAKSSPPAHMGGRVSNNYAHWRHGAGATGGGKMARMMGKPGASSIASAQKAKAGARAMVSAAGNRSKRAGRYLP